MSDPFDPEDPEEEGPEPEGSEAAADDEADTEPHDPAALGLGEREPDDLGLGPEDAARLGVGEVDPFVEVDPDEPIDLDEHAEVEETLPAGPGPTAAGALDALLERSDALPSRDRLLTLLELLGRPDRAQPAIVVVASHGASSIARMVVALLGALGLTAGTLERTHLQDLAERSRIAAGLADRALLEEQAGELAPFLLEADDRHPEPVTRDEALAALAFARFADGPVDVAVVEAGPGGAADPASVVRAEVAVVGPLDDEDVASAAEVAGRAATVVRATLDEATAEAIDGAVVGDARRVVVGRDAALVQRDLALAGQQVVLRGVTDLVDEIYLALQGAHQAQHAVAALAAVEGFLGFAGGLDPEALREGFAGVRAPGRLEVVRRPEESTVVLDLADRAPRTRALARALEDEFAFRNQVIVAAPSAEADVAACLRPLLGAARHLVAVPAPGAADPERVAAAGRALGASVELAADATAALDLAGGVIGEQDAVVVAGVPAFVGQVRAALGLDPA
ncbi:hypothetical protein ER308_03225 [Egibacter rhizosphaerae]|uniref:tetrahydrofolate synthase n=1 Tax=Egibacter rhizosphaerae TaxID=1670831 RepID=A0A411YBU8_9ACTN|nr:hypothetical protein [Egibacter rhizosphaerae]QBI18666.1 hypothetical protein ER308_03225 [Egibacter rhizosphaerae]